jgi:hypothetical protein
VAHTYNPSYLGGWDQGVWGSKPAWANNSRDLISKITRVKCGSSSRVPALQVWSPEFKPQSVPPKKQKRRKTECFKHSYEALYGWIFFSLVNTEEWDCWVLTIQFVKKVQIFFQSGYIILYSHEQCVRVLLVPHPHKIWCYLSFKFRHSGGFLVVSHWILFCIHHISFSYLF